MKLSLFLLPSLAERLALRALMGEITISMASL